MGTSNNLLSHVELDSDQDAMTQVQFADFQKRPYVKLKSKMMYSN